MSLTLALNNALAGLRVNQQSLGVLSQNIANVNTDGYSRQVVNQSAITVEGVGSGVKIDEISRKIDKYLQRAVLSQGSANQSAQAINNYYQRLQTIIGQPGAENSINEFMTTFFNTLQQLANNPETSSVRTNAVAAATTLAEQISSLAAGIEDLRFQADRDIQETVNTVNVTLQKLNDINKSIGRANGLGQSLAGLLDQRDAALRTLSENMNISVTYNANGTVAVAAGEGISIVEDGVTHSLQYSPAQSTDTLINGGTLSALKVLTFNVAGTQIGSQQLISSGVSHDITSSLTGGTLGGLEQVRDDLLPDILDQLDMLASRLRDDINAIHNNGSGFPPATSLTGDRLVNSGDQFNWEGAVRIAVLNPDGTPVRAAYADESYTGLRPLTLDLGSLNSGQGFGKPTMQTIIDEINDHFAAPGNKVEIGNLNNIRLASDTNSLPSNLFDFDLDSENLSRNMSNLFVQNIVVRDSAATNITSVTQAPPSVALSTLNTYTTTVGTGDVTINLATAPGVSVGDYIYLSAPSLPAVDGITAAQLTGYFKVNSIAGNQISITTTGTAATGTVVSDATPATMLPPYNKIGPGLQDRANDNGTLQVDLTASPLSAYYDITVDVGVVDAQTGVVSTSQITYRVQSNQASLYNKRFSATAATGAGTVVIPNTTQDALRAILVDADGNELPKINGDYVQSEEGYLKLIGGTNGTDSFSIAIDEMDSKQLGKPDDTPPQEGTNWAFSHFFGLNNLFKSNGATNTGETLKNSAIHLDVVDRIKADSNLISMGNLTLQVQPTDVTKPPQYTYLRYLGDNSTAQALAQKSNNLSSFEPAGGLPRTDVSLQTYTGEVLGYAASKTSAATEIATNAQALYDGFKSRSEAVSSVNLDEELANTIVYQNAYSATARVVTVVNSMFDSLLQMVGV